MNTIHQQNKLAQLLAVAVVLVGATTYAVARMAPASTRTIPYQGVLEQNGAAADGDYLMRFGLFVAPPDANAAQCVVSDTCALWSEEQLVTVTNGRFSVLLGDSDADLTDQLLANNTLHLVMAVKGAADPGVFSLMSGTQELVPQPWAARAAGAQDFRVRGALTVDGATSTSGLVVNGTSTHNGATSVVGSLTVSSGVLTMSGGSIAQVNGIGAQYVNTASLAVTNGLPITISGEYGTATGAAANYATMTLVTRSACFTTRNVFNSACTIYSNGTNWVLETWTNSDCRARCISW